MLLRIFSEALMYFSNKQTNKTFSESSPASLFDCIEIILNHSSGRCRDSLTMASLSFTKSLAFVQYLFTYASLATPLFSARKKMTLIPLLVFHLVQAFGTAKGFVC